MLLLTVAYILPLLNWLLLKNHFDTCLFVLVKKMPGTLNPAYIDGKDHQRKGDSKKVESRAFVFLGFQLNNHF